MGLLSVILRSITEALSPLIVEGLFNDFWQFKNAVNSVNKLSVMFRGLAYFYFRYMENKKCWIGLNSNVGGVITPHGLFGIFISDKAQIGQNAVIFHHVTIGSNNLKDSSKRGSPVIGNNVYIGAGAKIIGNVRIGNNVRIGANCIIVKDVPDNCVVVTKGTCMIHKEMLLDNTYIDNN